MTRKAKRNIMQITPFMHVKDFAAAVEFMTDIMGFNITIKLGNYAYLEREGCAIRILCVPEQYQPGNHAYAYYVDVMDVAALYVSLKPKLDTLPKAHVRGPVRRPYGVIELMVLMPDNNFMVFAELVETIAAEHSTVMVAH
jgi:hypothetical protein